MKTNLKMKKLIKLSIKLQFSFTIILTSILISIYLNENYIDKNHLNLTFTEYANLLNYPTEQYNIPT
jgi:hypothetical protein